MNGLTAKAFETYRYIQNLLGSKKRSPVCHKTNCCLKVKQMLFELLELVKGNAKCHVRSHAKIITYTNKEMSPAQYKNAKQG